jgi:hypothetical protein
MQSPILADVGLPMILVQWPLMLCALLPVIVIEALLVRRWLPLSYKKVFAGIARANLVSTLVGVPLAWLAMLALEFATLLPLGLAAMKWHWRWESPVFQTVGFIFGSAWVGPGSDSAWPVVLAAALLLIPSFYLSVWIERRLCLRSWPSLDPGEIRRAIFFSNLASYALLFVSILVWMSLGPETMTRALIWVVHAVRR